MIVDLGLPDRDGQQVIREIRAFSPVPILVLSARAPEAEKIAALDGGADDYVTKPFSSGELLAGARALLRRRVRIDSIVLRLGDVEVDLARREARRPGGPVRVTPLEFRVLESWYAAAAEWSRRNG